MRERKERGTVSEVVLFSVLTLFVIMLTTFSAVYVKSKSQLAETQMLRDTYDMGEKGAEDAINSYITFDNNYLEDNIYSYTADKSHYIAKTISSTFTNVQDTSAEEGYSIKATISGNSTTDGIYYSDLKTKTLTKGKTYTWSVELKGNKEKTLKIGNANGGELAINLKTTWTRYTNTFVATADSESTFEFYINNSSWSTGDELNIKSLQLEEGDGSQEKTTNKLRKKETFKDLKEPTRECYTFDGWYNDPIDGQKLSDTDKIPTEDTTYYAHWKTTRTEIATGFPSTITLSGSEATPTYTSSSISLENTASYIISFDYQCAQNTNDFNVYVTNVNLPSSSVKATTDLQHISITFTPESSNLSSCNIKITDDVSETDESDITITNFKLIKVE